MVTISQGGFPTDKQFSTTYNIYIISFTLAILINNWLSSHFSYYNSSLYNLLLRSPWYLWNYRSWSHKCITYRWSHRSWISWFTTGSIHPLGSRFAGGTCKTRDSFRSRRTFLSLHDTYVCVVKVNREISMQDYLDFGNSKLSINFVSYIYTGFYLGFKIWGGGGSHHW